jgi:hypothetical protein
MPLTKPLLFICLLLLLPTCVSRRVNVPPFIAPSSDASLADLIAIVNQRREVRTLTAKVDLQFETSEGAEEGRLRRFRTAQGRIILARPESIRLQIEAPVLGVNLAEMASDGRRFQLLIYPEDYRALIVGRNNREYLEQAEKMESDPELKKAGPLANIRPQHFTNAFLFDAIDLDDPETIVLMKEARPLEDDDSPGAKNGQMVIRSYYVLTVTRRKETSPINEYWFDRSRGLELVGQKSYSPQGLLLGDVEFSDYLPAQSPLGLSLPSETYLVRPYDKYALRITVKSGTLILNREIPQTAFSIESPPEWGNSVRQIDLDRTNH